jgi:hypothetical protein
MKWANTRRGWEEELLGLVASEGGRESVGKGEVVESMVRVDEGVAIDAEDEASEVVWLLLLSRVVNVCTSVLWVGWACGPALVILKVLAATEELSCPFWPSPSRKSMSLTVSDSDCAWRLNRSMNMQQINLIVNITPDQRCHP